MASVAGVLVLLIGLMAFCCVRQRRAGRREKEIEDAKYEKGTAELLAFRSEMARQKTMRTEQMQTRTFGGQRGYQRF